jgi:hypothetical protein
VASSRAFAKQATNLLPLALSNPPALLRNTPRMTRSALRNTYRGTIDRAPTLAFVVAAGPRQALFGSAAVLPPLCPPSLPKKPARMYTAPMSAGSPVHGRHSGNACFEGKQWLHDANFSMRLQ